MPSGPFSRRDLLIVANRLPDPDTPHAGGLVTALAAATDGRSVRWVGSLELTEAESAGYYAGFANQTIWPLFHGGIGTVHLDSSWWAQFADVNRRFAIEVLAEMSADDFVWVHDYHLMLLPDMLRGQRPRADVGFFLHIPFPSPEVFCRLPWREEVLRGILGADVVGLQTARDAEHFLRACSHVLGLEVTGSTVALPDGRVVVVGDFPAAVDTRAIQRAARHPSVRAAAGEIRAQVGNPDLVFLGIDRLDHTKGIENRLEAFALMRRACPDIDAVMIQIANPSREEIPDYQELRIRVEAMVGRVNGELGMLGAPAVHYARRTLDHRELISYYCAADVMLVTPLADGMNLVAKEYVSSRIHADGALVLSEFAGSAAELSSAFVVNPFDVEGMAQKMVESIRAPREERTARMRQMIDHLRIHDAAAWGREFLAAVPTKAAPPKAGLGVAAS